MSSETVDTHGRHAVGALKTMAERVGFWAAIGLPLIYLPLLSNGIADRRELAGLVGLLLLHFIAIVVGHRYNRD